jgi:hypothetical protein
MTFRRYPSVSMYAYGTASVIPPSSSNEPFISTGLETAGIDADA